MKKFFVTKISAVLVCVSCFISGCGFLSVDNEEIIETIAEHQLYYDNNSAEKLAKSVALYSSAAVLPGFQPYFGNGRVLFFSSKKLLYQQIKGSLFYLSALGYVDYDELKKISAKLANLQEKSTYKVTEAKNPLPEFREQDYQAYMLTFDHPDMNQIAQRILSGIQSDIENTYGVNLKSLRRFDMDASERLHIGLLELYKTTKDPAVLKQYGDIIVKNFSAALDDKIPFTTNSIDVYIKDENKKIRDIEAYVMPDSQGGNLVYFSNIMWNGFSSKLGEGSITSVISYNKLKLNDFTRMYSSFESLNEKNPAVMSKINQTVTKLEDAFQIMSITMLKMDDANSFEKFLDTKEQLDDELMAFVATTSRAVTNQPVQPQPVQPQQQPVQPPAPTNLNSLTNTEFGIVFRRYYSAIGDQRFADAYFLLSEKCRRAQGSLEDFAKGRQNVLSVEILDFRQTAASATNVTATYQIRIRDKIPSGIKVQVFNGNVSLIKTDGTWLIDSLSSTLAESHME